MLLAICAGLVVGVGVRVGVGLGVEEQIGVVPCTRQRVGVALGLGVRGES